MSSAVNRPVHVPVMPREVIQWLRIQPGQTVMDGTLGAAGHSRLILKALNGTGRLIGFDRDPMMLAYAEQNLRQEPLSDSIQLSLIHASYAESRERLAERSIAGVDRILLDLGLSSDQLSDQGRGFGFDAGGPLDMRFDISRGRPASELLAKTSQEELTSIFETYGEEPASRQIAAEIVRRRQTGQLISTAEQLEEVILSTLRHSRDGSGRNPATKVFQALRIAVNQELDHVERMFDEVLPAILNPGGIVVVLTFHSLEDRIVKNAFKGLQGWQILTKTPVEASPAEIRLNPRSRSAKLRAAQKHSVP
ncbi:MAG: 16S rRNA (cytosine(1402)-N(4))-methyltransferase RsmH [Planctomyces sp.]|nr:16S rRNA (cytosine(1402)-N(4))-methyltransferase RsmH [Planctomyces sp.]